MVKRVKPCQSWRGNFFVVPDDTTISIPISKGPGSGAEFFYDGVGAEAGVLAEFFDGDELVILLAEGFFYFL
ncbi:hypothetical protein OCK74_12355 [Chitinophagaceae bacterium LB-8]|uniref:Uncharacterized protein n=1 Tax=Paraflavisolibacter caeni TaxID=2982496 RepID=A0A9X2XVS1_9BACT|nr:hypothetical protein [Paraflavisolibacter caeni]MCU7549915.1 hypothetical protein [Paraflavisolibacter caeni]